MGQKIRSKMLVKMVKVAIKQGQSHARMSYNDTR